MGYLALIVVVLLLVFVLVPRLRLRAALTHAFPSNYAKILRRNVPEYRHLPTDLQMQLKRRIKQFLHEKKFVGCAGLEMSDEIKVTIAGKACLLLLNRECEIYPSLTHILVYPGSFLVPRQERNEDGTVMQSNPALSGESWSDGRVILAWDQIVNNEHVQSLGQDVVLHEFAHQLDSENGSTNGAPHLPSTQAYKRWSQLMQAEFDRLRAELEQGIPTLIDPYGATNPAEFFAVVTEAFYKKSHALAEAHPALFAELKRFYRVDPREWN